MNQRTIEILEYPRIREQIAGNCMSQEGTEVVKNCLPLTDEQEIATLKHYGALWMEYLLQESPPAFNGWPEIGSFISRLRVEGAALSLEEIHALGLFCESVRKFRAWGEQRQKSLFYEPLSPDTDNTYVNKPLSPKKSVLLNKISSIPDLSTEENEIFRVIDRSTGEIRNLPELRAIRQEIKRIKQDIERLIGSYLSDDNLKSGLQAKLPTIKDGRQVIALKAGSRNRIRGIVHEVSQSGQTVYVEPEDVVHKNNDLVSEEHHLAREIARILRLLTDTLCPSHEKIAIARDKMIFFDGIGAAARWGKRFVCDYAAASNEQKLDQSPILLKQARHPLLGKSAVPIDLLLTPGGRQLIITGPNTGGKTVSLKTVGLLALINQSGWPIPAALGSSLPVFDYIGCDIGDEQSLDQSLSTFSGHMKNISEILSRATEKSLVLLDELGSGTDPQEGSAIAMAVLDALMEKNPVVLVTTHHGILKNYGYTHKTCINASVDFDHDTLSPTYRIVMGIPGESHALDVAEKNGLDPKIVEKARSYLHDDRADVSALIKGLSSKHEAIDSLEQENKREKRDIHEKRRRIDLKELQLRQKEFELREQGYKKLTTLLDEGRKQLENLVRKVREGELTREKNLEVKAWMTDLEKQLAGEYEMLQQEHAEIGDRGLEIEKKHQEKTSETYDISKFEPGAEVYIGASKQCGIIIREKKNGKWLVSVGPIKMTVDQTELRIVSTKGRKDNRVKIDVSTDLANGDTPSFELRLLGMRAEEAIKALERQFDLAMIKGLEDFSVIHGKGTGALQKAVHEFLLDHGDQCTFSFARPEQGGTGKTMVSLRIS